MRLEEILKNLGLPLKETKVFLALLELKSATLSALGRHINLPRTSLYPLLNSLKEKELVYPGKIKNHSEWKVVTPRTLYRKYQEHLEELKRGLPELEKVYEKSTNNPNISPITYYEGLEGVRRVYELLLKLPKEERAYSIYSIEGSASIDAKLKAFHNEFAIDWQSAFKKSGLIWESITSEASLKAIEKMDTRILKAHLGRMVILTILPEKLLNFSLEIIAFQNTAAIVSVEKRRVVIVRDEAVAEAVRDMVSILTNFGKKIDLNAFIAEVIRRKENK